MQAALVEQNKNKTASEKKRNDELGYMFLPTQVKATKVKAVERCAHRRTCFWLISPKWLTFQAKDMHNCK